MIVSLSNSSVCSRTSANPPIVVVTTDNRMNNPLGSIPAPTTVAHTTVVAPPPMGIPMPPLPIGQAINTTPIASNAIDGDSLSSMDMRKLSNIEFDALVSAEKNHRLLQSSSSLISQSEVLVDEFTPPLKLGTIFASIADSDEAVIAGERVPIKCEDVVISDLTKDSSHSPSCSSLLKNLQTQIIVNHGHCAW